MKIISWNVNGIRACINKGFMDSIKKINPDIICLQETKCQKGQVQINLEGFKQYWNYAEKKGYSGTAIFTKKEPLKVTYDLGKDEHDKEGRLITLEFDNFVLINAYVPNSKRGLLRLNDRKEWDKYLLAHIKKQKKKIIFCGDLNVAHTKMDIKNAKSNYNVSAGYTQTEIDGFENYLTVLKDSFRELHPKTIKYSWWSYMFNSRANNTGWRIDYFLVSDMKMIKEAFILNDIMGSDHCPVGVVLK